MRALLILIGLVAVVAYWFLPIEGTVLVSSMPLDPEAHFPQYHLDPPAPQPGDEIAVTITDNVPWTHVKLTANGEPVPFLSTQALPLRQQWSWTWQVTLAPADENEADETASTEPNTTLAFYRDCDSGCRLRDQRPLEPFAQAGQSLPREAGPPTKLCAAFPDPERDWHGRSGWGMDLTYAVTEVAYWQIDELAQRVQQSTDKGLRMLVRIDYAPEQSLPPQNDEETINIYLEHVRRLARDERLASVYGYIIGTGFNAADSNKHSPEFSTTPEWYATLFNGPDTNNVVQTIRTNNPSVRVLVGPVRPWITTQGGGEPYKIDAPWLNYMNVLVAAIDANSQRYSALGMPLMEPDGFALNAPGRPDALDPDEVDPALEPTLSVPSDNANGAEMGFRVYKQWLDIINGYPTTQGKPAYITSTNTFAPDSTPGSPAADESLPAQNYPSGWLTNALTVINQEPQIQSLCWFLDLIPNDQRWHGFSLAFGEGRMGDAAEEFDQLIQE